jgi:hypothetical protein
MDWNRSAMVAMASSQVMGVNGMIDPFEVAVHFDAEEALGERVGLVASEVNRAALLDLHRHAAGIGAIVGAHRPVGGDRQGKR